MEQVGKPTKRSDAVTNRARILEVAQSVFAERGLELEMNEVAAQAHLGVGTLYGHFANREDLLRAIVLRAVDDSLAQLRAALVLLLLILAPRSRLWYLRDSACNNSIGPSSR